MNSPRTRFYRDKQNGKMMGVCAGIADYTGISSIWIRLAAIGLIFTGGWIIPLYFIVGFLADKIDEELEEMKRALKGDAGQEG